MVNKNEIYYSFTGSNQENDMKVRAEITQQLQINFKDVFNGIGCFNGTFCCRSSQIENHTKHTPRCVVYVLQKPLKVGLE